MQYRTMPNSNEKLSVLGYGCMRLPTRIGGEASSLIDKQKALKQIRYAIDNGVNYLDTAYPYHLGASESFLGEYVLKDGYREKVNIATKLPCFTINKKESIEEIFNKQLKKLQVDYIDYYLLHALDGKTWDKMVSFGIIDFMDKIRKEGKVRHMGFSFHGTRDDFKRIVDSYNWEFAQVQFNILDENFQAGIEGIEYAHSKGLGIIVMEPLRGGSLVGKIPQEVGKLYDSAKIKRNPVDWALRWIWNHPAVTLILSGMNNEDHIKENIKIASESLPNGLTDTEINILNDVRNKYHELMKVGCTGCAYCMPCPAGINIPGTFKSLNNYHMFSKFGAKMSHMIYAGVQTKDGKSHWTSSCLDCGKCEKACPQGIKIREKFKDVERDLESIAVKGVAKVARKIMRK
ncbi:aldo/keto reductase [Clostridium oceanicum]|uniref:Aldo/keto reductase n=1 Tax=Clostridium oceanicum TaxID=1543 RepID=A0ABN1JM74_9CLOT